MRIAAPHPRWHAAWAAQRYALWPDADPEELAQEAGRWLAAPPANAPSWLAIDGDGALIGFAEAAIRHDSANGCETSPVAFLEGIYVDPAHRGRGVGRALVRAVEAWARSAGLHEIGSDALLDNRASHAFHAAIGFAETERVVFFRRPIGA